MVLIFFCFLFPIFSSAFFTENSFRRKASPNEAASVVRLGRCTGFFLANSQERLLIATARHCLDESPEEWCYPKKFQDAKFYTADYNYIAECKQVIISDNNKDDFVVFEATPFTDWNKNIVKVPVRPFRMADFHAKVGTSLNIIGFPGDYAFSSYAIVSSGCADSSGRSYVFWNPQIRTPANSEQLSKINDPGIKQYAKYRGGWHNCSTWGGNSGGPVIYEGTDIALGMVKIGNNTTRIFPSDAAAYYTSSKTVIDHERDKLLNAGIILVSMSSTAL